MTIHLPFAEEEKIRAHGARAYHEEACGILIGREDRSRGDGPELIDVEVIEARPLDNVKKDERERRYIIDPMALLRIEEELDDGPHRIVGIYHSHPDHPAQPSRFDQDHAWPGLSYLILAVADGQPRLLTSWRLSDDRATFHPEPLVLARTTESHPRDN